MSRSDSTWRGRLARLLTVVHREPTGATPAREVRIKLQALPAPLRAVARAQVEKGLLIEAELPWLTVGSEVEAELPEGMQKGRVHWFGVDVSHAGSARLRVFVDLSPPGSASASAEGLLKRGRLPGFDLPSSPARRGWQWLAFAVMCVAAAFVGGWMAPHPARPAFLPSLIERAPLRLPRMSTVPKQLPDLWPHADATEPASVQTSAKAKAKPRRK